jgi:hypothetical protein
MRSQKSSHAHSFSTAMMTKSGHRNNDGGGGGDYDDDDDDNDDDGVVVVVTTVIIRMITMTITHQNYNANENLITKHEEEFKN